MTQSNVISYLCACALIVGMSLAFSTPAQALRLGECRDALRGWPATNDNEAERGRRILVGFGHRVSYWTWGEHERKSPYRINQWVVYHRYSNTPLMLLAKCNDRNRTGQIGSDEDSIYDDRWSVR